MVYCGKNKVAEVKDIIASLDNNLDKMYYPITTITNEDDMTSLNLKIDLVVQLLDNPEITASTFHQSADLNASDDAVKYVIYVDASPENIDLITDMWNKIG